MNQKSINKQALIALIINSLEQDMNQAINAANEAHAAAVDDESVAETQYDTLAIEASYLAEGQSRRVQELQAAINDYQVLNLFTFNEQKKIGLSALVKLADKNQAQHWFFIGPAAGGFRCQLNGQNITVITPKSPMGLALMGKFLDDDIEVMLGNKKVINYISRVQ
jgi:transcription elongation GreA/GreB family factor